MNTSSQSIEAEYRSPPAEDVTGVALACELPADSGSDGRIWIPAGVSHRIRIADPAHRARLLAAIFDMKADPDLKLVLLGAEVGALDMEEKTALRARIGFLSGDGGLLSHLNAWENMILPLGCHHPERLPGIAAQVHALLDRLGVPPIALLGKLPEEMTLLEKKVSGFVRILLEGPDLLLVENFAAGLDNAERMQLPYFAATYHASHPGGTFVQLEDVLGD